MYLTKNQLSQITQQITPQETEYVASVNALVNGIGTQEYKNNLINIAAKSEEEATKDSCSRESLIILLNTIMAFRDKFQNLHWSASSMSYHKTIDEFIVVLTKYIDDFAELIQGIYGQFSGGEITSLTLPTSEDPTENIAQLRDCIQEMLETLNSEENQSDSDITLIDSLTNIQSQIFKYMYLFRICKNN